jgi:hypothetical protein
LRASGFTASFTPIPNPLRLAQNNFQNTLHLLPARCAFSGEGDFKRPRQGGTAMTNLLQSSMRTIAALVACVALSQTLHAQAKIMRVQVPFAFEFGRAHMEPGAYTIDLRNLDLVTLSDQKGTYLDSMRTEFTDRPLKRGLLVFKKYGEHYVLCEAWIAGSNSYLSVHDADRRRWMKENERSSNDTGTEVTVALVEAPAYGHAE